MSRSEDLVDNLYNWFFLYLLWFWDQGSLSDLCISIFTQRTTENSNTIVECDYYPCFDKYLHTTFAAPLQMVQSGVQIKRCLRNSFSSVVSSLFSLLLGNYMAHYMSLWCTIVPLQFCHCGGYRRFDSLGNVTFCYLRLENAHATEPARCKSQYL